MDEIQEVSGNERVFPACYNRLPRKADWEISNFKMYADELRLRNFTPGVFNRSHWEKLMTLTCMEHLGFLNNKNTVINIGGGIDAINYYLSKYLKKIVSADLYDDSWPTCPSSVLENPDLYAPFEYNRNSLKFERIDSKNKLPFNDDTFSAAIAIGPSLNFIGYYEDIVYAIKEFSRTVENHGILFMDLDLSLTSVRAVKSDSEYFFSPDSLQKLFIETPFKPICKIDLSNPDFQQEETRADRWLPPKRAWNSIGVIPSRIMRNFPFIRIVRPTIFPVLVVSKNEKLI